MTSDERSMPSRSGLGPVGADDLDRAGLGSGWIGRLGISARVAGDRVDDEDVADRPLRERRLEAVEDGDVGGGSPCRRSDEGE